MGLYEQSYADVPNGTDHSAITAATDQTYTGDVLNYPVQGGQLTAITGRTHGDGLFVAVDSFVTNAGTTQDYTFTFDYDTTADSDYWFYFGGPDTDNCYQGRIRRQSGAIQMLLYKRVAGGFNFLTSINPTVSVGNTYTYTYRHVPTGVFIAYGNVSDELFYADTSFPNPNGQPFSFRVELAAPAGSGVHITDFVQFAPNAVAPVITNNGGDPYKWPVGQLPYVPPNVTANDDLDGDITDKLQETGDIVDPNTKGSYFRTYNVDDSAGNSATPLTLEVRVQDPVNIPKDYAVGTYTITVDYESSNNSTSQDTGTLEITPPNIEVNLGTASETDTANDVSPALELNLGTASESDASNGSSIELELNLGTATETDSSNSVDPAQAVDLGSATEDDTSNGSTIEFEVNMGTASESDSALSIASGADEVVDLGTASETDNINAITPEEPSPVEINLGAANETDTANSTTVVDLTPIILDLAPPMETGQANSISPLDPSLPTRPSLRSMWFVVPDYTIKFYLK